MTHRFKNTRNFFFLSILICFHGSIVNCEIQPKNQSSLFINDKDVKETKFSFNFDESISVADDEFTGTGLNFVTFVTRFVYKPDPNGASELVLTDLTSINAATQNGQTCQIPFTLNQIDNYFCALDQSDVDSDLQCQTGEGLSECTLGKFMLVRPSRGLSTYSTRFQFTEKLVLERAKLYEFEFSYLVNIGLCEGEDIELVIYLYDLEQFQETLFKTNTEQQALVNNRWTKFTQCFRTFDGEFFLFIEASSRTCEISNNQAFSALDGFQLKEIQAPGPGDVCLDFTAISTSPQSTLTITSTASTTTTATTRPPPTPGYVDFNITALNIIQFELVSPGVKYNQEVECNNLKFNFTDFEQYAEELIKETPDIGQFLSISEFQFDCINNEAINTNGYYRLFSREIYFKPSEIRTGLNEFHRRLAEYQLQLTGLDAGVQGPVEYFVSGMASDVNFTISATNCSLDDDDECYVKTKTVAPRAASIHKILVPLILVSISLFIITIAFIFSMIDIVYGYYYLPNVYFKKFENIDFNYNYKF